MKNAFCFFNFVFSLSWVKSNCKLGNVTASYSIQYIMLWVLGFSDEFYKSHQILESSRTLKFWWRLVSINLGGVNVIIPAIAPFLSLCVLWSCFHCCFTFLSNNQKVGSSNPAPFHSIVVFLGKTLTPILVPMRLAAPCIAAATHWCVGEWVNGRPLYRALGSQEGTGKYYISAVHLPFRIIKMD